MVESIILEDVVVEVMVVTKTAEVMGKLEPLHHNMVGGNEQTNESAHCYAFPGRSDVETSNVVITGNLLVCDCMASVCLILDPHFLMYLPHFLMV